MRIFLLMLVTTIWLSASSYSLNYWQSGETFSGYLTRHNIDSTKVYSQIDPDDMEFLSEIQSKSPFFENISNGVLKEALIPIGEEMQIYIAKKGKDYIFDIIPIDYKVIRDTVTVTIDSNCFLDIKKATNNAHLATYLKRAFKDKVDFTKLKKGDKVVIKYRQKSIKGLPWEEPIIEAAYINSGSKEFFVLRSSNEYKVWSNSDSVTKTTSIKEVAAKYIHFTKPLSVMRVTSNFTYKRWHPILHRYRPHLGLDLGAKKGTPIHALADGKVVYAGWMGGYGRVVKINHGNGYLTLYAHQSKILVKKGQRVRAGQIIGKVGSSGRSTGPHLHLGVYRQGKAVNPQLFINHFVKVKDGVRVKKVVKIISNLSKELPLRAKIVYNSMVNIKSSIFKWKSLNSKIDIKIVRKRRVKQHEARVQLSNSKGDA